MQSQHAICSRIYLTEHHSLLWPVMIMVSMIIGPAVHTDAQTWNTVRVVDFSDPGINSDLNNILKFKVNGSGWALGDFGATGASSDACALNTSFSHGNRLMMKLDLKMGKAYRLSVKSKADSGGEEIDFFHRRFGPGFSRVYITQGLQVPALNHNTPGVAIQSDVFSVDAEGEYWLAVKHYGDNSPGVSVRLDNFRLEVMEESECSSVAGPDHTICAGESVQLGTGCLPEPHPVEGVEYCYAWEPSNGLDNPGSSMPNASPSETTTYTVYVTSSEGELIAEDEVTVNVIEFHSQIFPAHPVLCIGPVELSSSSTSPQNSYEWSTGNNEPFLVVSQSGDYSLTVTNNLNGCESISQVKVIDGGDPYAIKNYFTSEEGYVEFDIEVLGEIGLQQSDTTTNTRQPVNGTVIDYSDQAIFFDESNVDPEQFLTVDIDKAVQDGTTAKAYITRNENFCSTAEPNLGSQIRGGFDLNDQEHGILMHIWEAPTVNEQSKMFLKFFPFFSKEVPVLSTAEIEAAKGDKCPIYDLPATCDEQFLPYTVSTYDEEEFYGFNCEEGIWHEGDIVEYLNPISGLADPSQYECCDGSQMISDGKVSKIEIGFNPASMTKKFGYNPSFEAYQYASFPGKYPTEKLVKSFYNGYDRAFGLVEVSKFQTERDVLFDHFITGKGDLLIWKCDSEISSEGFGNLSPIEDIISEFRLLLEDWLEDHDDLNNFFIEKQQQIGSISPPNLSLPFDLWVFALMGGTQGNQIEIRKFTNFGNCFEIEVVFSFYDNFGLGLEEKWWIPGLAEQFVLQHFRNYDENYMNCSGATPCFLPVKEHTAEVLKKYIICNE